MDGSIFTNFVRRFFLNFLYIILSIDTEQDGADAGETCSYIFNNNVQYVYCANNCCGSVSQRYCCALTTTGLYVGAIAGGAVCVALIVGIIICCVYKGKNTSVRRHRQRQDRNYEDDDLFTTHIYRAGTPKPPPYSLLPPPAYSEIENNNNDVNHEVNHSQSNVPNSSTQTNNVTQNNDTVTNDAIGRQTTEITVNDSHTMPGSVL